MRLPHQIDPVPPRRRAPLDLISRQEHRVLRRGMTPHMAQSRAAGRRCVAGNGITVILRSHGVPHRSGSSPLRGRSIGYGTIVGDEAPVFSGEIVIGGAVVVDAGGGGGGGGGGYVGITVVGAMIGRRRRAVGSREGHGWRVWVFPGFFWAMRLGKRMVRYIHGLLYITSLSMFLFWQKRHTKHTEGTLVNLFIIFLSFFIII